MSKDSFTPAEAALFDHLRTHAGWLDDWADAQRKYTSLSSGERYVMEVLENVRPYPLDPERHVDSDYARLVDQVLRERGQR